jgi:flagellar protein FlhE
MDTVLPAGGAGRRRGAWQASSMGITLNHRGESMSSRPLSPSEPATGLMTLVAWNYN